MKAPLVGLGAGKILTGSRASLDVGDRHIGTLKVT